MNKHDTLVYFKTHIALAWIMSGKNKANKKSDKLIPLHRRKKKYKTTGRPVSDVRYDCYDHWPEHINNN